MDSDGFCLVKRCENCGHAFVMGWPNKPAFCPACDSTAYCLAVRDHRGPIRLSRAGARALAKEIKSKGSE